MKNLKKILFSAVVAVLAVTGTIWGITTTFSEVVLENVQLGRSYNFRILRNLPLVLTNNRLEAEDAQIRVEKPADTLKPGYEPIPDVSWIQIIPNEFRLAPKESAQSDIILTIPDDEQYIGKHYQADIISEGMPIGGTGQMTIALSIRNRIRFSVKTKGPAELLAEKKLKKMKTLDFELDPTNIQVKNTIELGKKINLKQDYGIKLNLINKATEAIKINMKAISYEPRFGARGDLEIGDPKFLNFKPQKFNLKGESIVKVDIYINIPKEDKYKNKKLVFFIMAEVVDAVPVEVYSKMIINTGE